MIAALIALLAAMAVLGIAWGVVDVESLKHIAELFHTHGERDEGEGEP